MATQSNTKTLSAEDFDKIERIKKENEVLRANLSSKTKENEVLKANLSSKTKENEVLKADLSSKTKEDEVLKANLSSKTKENEVLKRTIEQIKSDNQKLNTTLREIGKINEGVKTDTENLKKEYNELKSIDNKRLIALDWAYKILKDASHNAHENSKNVYEQAEILRDITKEVAKGIYESGDIS